MYEVYGGEFLSERGLGRFDMGFTCEAFFISFEKFFERPSKK